MTRSRTPQYRGPLSPKLAADVSAASLRNANRLIEDARVLISAGRYPTAVSLSVLAIEEATKADMVRLIVSARTAELLKQAWQAFRNHASRQNAFMTEVMHHVSRNPDWLQPELGSPEEMLSLFKELGFYVDLTPKGQDFDEPERHFGNHGGQTRPPSPRRRPARIIQSQVGSCRCRRVRSDSDR
jgi:AbiV family abortive infection protein